MSSLSLLEQQVEACCQHELGPKKYGSIVIVDHSRLPEDFTNTTNPRANFYFQVVGAEQPFSEYSILIPIDSRRRPTPAFDNGDLASVFDSLPTKQKQMIFVQTYEGSAKEPLLTFVGDKFCMFVEHNTKNRVSEYIKADSMRGTLAIRSQRL